jgi:CheY-like chemotaxis protein
MLTRALSTVYEVEAFADGISAVRRLEHPPAPDLVISDVMMPGMDGFALAKRTKADPKLQNIPFMFLTARTAPQDVIHGIQSGARHYVTKPFKLDDLMKKVKKILGGDAR